MRQLTIQKKLFPTRICCVTNTNPHGLMIDARAKMDNSIGLTSAAPKRLSSSIASHNQTVELSFKHYSLWPACMVSSASPTTAWPQERGQNVNP